uniref:Uncharacterized protein n=1 Tax=Anguilla anguilla TaxID=7936 RepID=A0A0E9Q5H1_ANGAN
MLIISHAVFNKLYQIVSRSQNVKGPINALRVFTVIVYGHPQSSIH